jgi:hydrogenase expression/formation protein HypD
VKHQDEFRDGETARRLADRLAAACRRPIRLMEICGTHTMSVFRHGLPSLFPENLRLISGPGCPVCVTATQEIDRVIALARLPNLAIATFGDLVRVPGSESSLKEETSRGADVRVVYSPLDAVELARQNPGRQVVFIGIGFETTAPAVAAAVLSAAAMKLDNFSVLAAHKLLPPAMHALLAAGDLAVDGFLCPGHVTTIIGADAYRPIAETHGAPCVVAGFEPVDVLQGLVMLAEMIENGDASVAVQYRRGASWEGNRKARQIMERVFQPQDAPWRGLGLIPQSGLGLKNELRLFDAARRFDVNVAPTAEPPGCRCGDVLRGRIRPTDCALFSNACTPAKPVGPCMVSSEGACAAHYRYMVD